MSGIEGYIVDYISNDQLHGNKENDIILQQIYQEMKNPQNPISLQDLIEMLEPSLTSSQDKERNRATLLLAELLAMRKKKKNDEGGKDDDGDDEDNTINAMMIHLFVIFFCRRLTDYPSLSPSLYALTTLCTQYTSSFDAKYCDVLDILQSLTKDIHVPQYAQNIRQRVYELFEFILLQSSSTSSSPSPLSSSLLQQGVSISLPIVDGIVNSMEDEKDPRCLLLAMKVYIQLTTLFANVLDLAPVTGNDDYNTLAEKIFDNISCYFPISFTPPPDDPFGITPEILGQALEDAMCKALPIVKHSIPFLIEQIHNDMSSARVYALKGLHHIVELHRHRVLRGKAADLLPTPQPPSSKLLSSTYHQQDHHGHGHGHSHEEDDDEVYQSYLQRLSNICYDIVLTEGSQELVDLTFRLVGAITYSVSKGLMSANKPTTTSSEEGNCEQDWHIFHDNILRKAQREFGVGNIESLRSKLAWKLCMVIGTSGGCLVSARIVKQLYPLVMNRVQSTLLNMHKLLTKTVNASKRHIKLLSTHTLVMTNDDKIFPASLSMLESLLCCALPVSINISQLQEFNPLSIDEQQVMIKLLMNFIDPIALDEQTNDAVDASSVKMEVDGDEENSLLKLDADACAALIHAIHAMKTFLMRSKGYVAGTSLFLADDNCDNKHAMRQYLQRITNILCYGVEYIFYPASGSSQFENDHFQSYCQALHLNVQEENVIIRSACSELLIQLADIPGGQRILHEEILPKIITLATTSSVKALQDRLGKLLSEIAIKSSSLETFELIVNQLMPSILNALSDSQASVDVAHRLLEIIVNCFSPDQKGESGNVLTDKSTQSKAVFLSTNKTNTNESSPLVRLVAAFEKFSPSSHQNVEFKIVSSTIMSLVAKVMFHLQQAEEQDALLQIILQTYPAVSSLFDDSNSSIRAEDDISTEFLVNLLMNADKRCSLFSTTATSSYSATHLGSTLIAKWQHALQNGSQAVWHYSSQCLAIIINKLQDVGALEGLLKQVIQVIQQNVEGGSASVLPMIELLVSTMKGLVLRPLVPCKYSAAELSLSTSSNSTNWQGIFLDTFLALLFSSTNTSLAEACALQLTMLLQDPEIHTILARATSRGNYALLWQQKLFSLIFPPLQQQVRALSGKATLSTSIVNNPVAVLLATSKIIKGVSHSLLKSNFPNFVESIIFVLSYLNTQQERNNLSISMAEGEAINALNLLIKENAAAFVDHLHIIIPRLIKIAQTGRDAKTRSISLECLADLPLHISYPKLHPHRKNVVNGLMSVLDDRKRAVRELASKVRNDWILFQ